MKLQISKNERRKLEKLARRENLTLEEYIIEICIIGPYEKIFSNYNGLHFNDLQEEY